MKKKTTLVLVIAAVALLGVDTLLSRCGQQTLAHAPVTTAKVPEVEYPRERARRLAKQPKPAPEAMRSSST